MGNFKSHPVKRTDCGRSLLVQVGHFDYLIQSSIISLSFSCESLYHLCRNFWDDPRVDIGIKLVWACLSSEILPDEIRILKFRTISDRDNGTPLHTQLGARSQSLYPICFDLLFGATTECQIPMESWTDKSLSTFSKRIINTL